MFYWAELLEIVNSVQYHNLPLGGGVMPKRWPVGRAGSAATGYNDEISCPLYQEHLSIILFRMSERVIKDIHRLVK